VTALVVAGLAIYGFRKVRMIYVPTGSMMNTILPGDRIMARRFSGEVKRGQVLLFQYRGDSNYYLGRVIGLPNETVEVRDTLVYINGRPLDEERMMIDGTTAFDANELKEISTEGTGPYRVYYTAGPEGAETRLARAEDTQGPYRVPADSFFLMGDNRDNSEDSRYRGPVSRKSIWGEAWIIYYSSTVESDEVRSDRAFKRVR
jgi:signal peptidase I